MCQRWRQKMLKDQHFAANLGSVLRKLKPTRQVECVELMLTANNMTVAYAEALLAATPPHLLVSEKRPRKLSGVTAEQMVKMEREMGNLQGQLKLVEKSYGQDVLLLELSNRMLAFLRERGQATRSQISVECFRGKVLLDASLEHLLASTPPKITVRWDERAGSAPGAPLRVYRLVAG
ncbi:plasmid partitioning protein RepB C-terminal domain-containing protein [Verminephrobacter eiseniae]|uniref:plasmid partitioning protein RepB C-terminal domain-containing protein n=1 Tax=Verminephrobacter eiseniae TaxID=364317 RepID=UPI0038B2F8BC